MGVVVAQDDQLVLVLQAEYELLELRSVGFAPNHDDQFSEDTPETTERLVSREFPSPELVVWPGLV